MGQKQTQEDQKQKSSIHAKASLVLHASQHIADDQGKLRWKKKQLKRRLRQQT